MPNLLRRYVDREPADGSTGVGVGVINAEDESGVAFSKAKGGPTSSPILIVTDVKKNFVIQSVHQPLQYLHHAKPVSSRLTRWALLLQPHSYHVQRIAGKDNVGADSLSRAEIED